MPEDITGQNQFDDDIQVPKLGEFDYADTIKDLAQKLTNRSTWLKNVSDEHTSDLSSLTTKVNAVSASFEAHEDANNFLQTIDGVSPDSGNIDLISGTGMNIVSGSSSLSFSVDDYISSTEVASISAGLFVDIGNLNVALTTETRDASANALVQANAYTDEQVESITTNHNSLTGLQGGTSGQYYHLTQDQYNDYIGSTEVASVSASLQSAIDSIDLQEGTGITVIEAPLDTWTVSVDDYISSTEVASISAGLDSRISNTTVRNTITTGISGAYTASAFESVYYDPSGGSFTINAPSGPTAGDRFTIKNRSADTTSITVSGNGSDIEAPNVSFSLSASVSVSGDGISVTWEYDGTDWLIV